MTEDTSASWWWAYAHQWDCLELYDKAEGLQE